MLPKQLDLIYLQNCNWVSFCSNFFSSIIFRFNKHRVLKDHFRILPVPTVVFFSGEVPLLLPLPLFELFYPQQPNNIWRNYQSEIADTLMLIFNYASYFFLVRTVWVGKVSNSFPFSSCEFQQTLPTLHFKLNTGKYLYTGKLTILFVQLSINHVIGYF